jgi:hypothetical protein
LIGSHGFDAAKGVVLYAVSPTFESKAVADDQTLNNAFRDMRDGRGGVAFWVLDRAVLGKLLCLRSVLSFSALCVCAWMRTFELFSPFLGGCHCGVVHDPGLMARGTGGGVHGWPS